jgi:hypothetical protein
MSDRTIRGGEYSMRFDTITLDYGQHCVSEIYNFENEIDTSAVDYFVRDTVLKPISIQYLSTICNNRIELVDAKNREIAIETNSDYRTAIELLTKEGFIERLENIKK